MPNFARWWLYWPQAPMNRKFVVNLALLLLLNLLIKPVYILLDIQVQNTVGPDDYGLFFAVFNFSYLFQVFLDFGINNFNNRAVAQDEGHLYRYLPALFSLKILLAVVYGVVSFIGGDAVGFSPLQMHMLGWLIVNQFLLSMLLFLRSNLSGMHHFRTDSLVSVMDKLLLSGILLVLLFGGSFKASFEITWFVYAQTASLLATVLLAGSAVLYYSGKIQFKSDWATIGRMMRQTFPYALFGIFMSIYYRVDGVMIERMLPANGAYEAGVYAACYRLLDAANIIGLLFAGLLLPMFSRMMASNESPAELLSFSFRTLVGGAIMVAVIVDFYGEPVIELLYQQSTPYWSQVLRILFWAFPGVSTVYIYGTVLLAGGHLRIINILTFLTMLLNIGLNLFLIPEFKALGATWASIITQVLASVGMVYFAHRDLKIPFPFLDLLRMALLGIAVALVGLAFTYLAFDWKIKLALVSIIGAALAFVLRVFEWKALVGLMKNR